MLDAALGALLGVSIPVLEATLGSFAPSVVVLSQDHRKKVLATLLAIKGFETQLAGERSIWQLVVDKARAWMSESPIVKDADIKELEKLVELAMGI